MTSLNPLI